jgi:CheY-like chemotaxis protein
MARLLDDLLDVSRITRDQLVLRKSEVELAPIVQAAADACRPMFDAAGVALSVSLPSSPVVLEADATRLEQVFGNLLTNAAKYTKEGGRAALTTHVAGGTVSVRITDTGIGIPTEMLSAIFDMFVQVDASPAASGGGLGIGLSLVKRLIELHGGTVVAESAGEGLGSTFVVTLPVLVSQPRVSPHAESQAKVVRSRRVLIVDDDEDSGEILSLLLQSAGHVTRVARDGVSALSEAAAFRPELVLLDLGLPGASGHDVCRRMRAEPWGASIFIAALTGWGQEQDRRLTAEAGFDRHFVKPVDPEELLSLLARLAPATP